jgi:hypothetical protein
MSQNNNIHSMHMGEQENDAHMTVSDPSEVEARSRALSMHVV